jgi:hypothetical protein
MTTKKIVLSIPETIFETISKRCDGRVEAHFLQFLTNLAELSDLVPDKRFFDEFRCYLKKKEKALAYYPPKVRDLMELTLKEIAPAERWVFIKDIADLLNCKLQALGTNTKPYTPKKVGNLLTALGFMRRSRPGSPRKVLVEQEIIRRYSNHSDSANGN